MGVREFLAQVRAEHTELVYRASWTLRDVLVCRACEGNVWPCPAERLARAVEAGWDWAVDNMALCDREEYRAAIDEHSC